MFLTFASRVLNDYLSLSGSGWNVAAIARDAYDVEGKVIGTIGAGRIGYRVLQRMLPFDPKELLYYDYTALPAAAEKEVKARRVEDLKEFLGKWRSHSACV